MKQLLPVILLFAAAVPDCGASTRNYRGRIVAVDLKAPRVGIAGLNLHGGREGQNLGSTLHTWCVFLLDTRVVTPAEALVVGRQCVYYHEVVVQALSEEHTVYDGVVSGVSDTNLTLRVLLKPEPRKAPPPKPPPPRPKPPMPSLDDPLSDTSPVEGILPDEPKPKPKAPKQAPSHPKPSGPDPRTDKGIFGVVSVPLTAPVDVKIGDWVHVLPGRRQTLEARTRFSPVIKSLGPAPSAKPTPRKPTGPPLDSGPTGKTGGEEFALEEPEKVEQEVQAKQEKDQNDICRGNILECVVKSVDEKDLELWVFKNGKPEQVTLPRPRGHVYLDCNPVKASELIVPGRRLVYVQVSKRGGPGHETHVFGISDENGRTQGIVKSIAGSGITVTTLTASGAADVTIPLSEPVVRLNGKLSERSKLKPGMPVVVSSERKQKIIKKGQ